MPGYEDISVAATQMVMGASERVRLLANVGPDLEWVAQEINLDDVLQVADRRLRLQALLCLGLPSGVRPNPAGRPRLDELVDCGWELRFSTERAAALLLVVDDDHALVAPGDGSRLPRFEYVSMTDEITGFHRGLDIVWDRAMKPESLYVTPCAVDSSLIVASKQYWDHLICSLANDPAMMHDLDPRKFEELVADLLGRQGLQVELTPASRDGGRDILARASNDLGDHLYYVECKRYAPDRPVGVEIVRRVYGVVEADRATAGLIVTTSAFTSGAREFRESVSSRMSLRQYDDVVRWIRSAQAGASNKRIERAPRALS